MDFSLFTEKLFARAKERGLEKCEVYSTKTDSFRAAIHEGNLVQYSVSQGGGLTFRALYQGKMGVVSTQVLDEEAIGFLIDGAIENAAMIENDDPQFLVEAGSEYVAMDNYSEKVAQPTAQEKIQLARDLEKMAAASDPRIRPNYSSVFSSISEERLVNSLGLDLSYRDSMLGFSVSLQAREGEDLTTGGRMVFGRDPEALSREEAVQYAVDEALTSLGGQPVPTGTYPVLMRREAMADMLSCFDSVFSAEMAQKGLSLLKGREGEVIASDKLTIVDDPHHPTATRSMPFDGEGSPTYKKNVVENGKLMTLLHNLKTANKQGVATTGNASRSGGGVGVAPFNFYIQPGQRNLEEMAAAMGEGLLITDLAGLHSGANQISGDFSLGASGYLIENGKVGRSVRQITIAGNFFQMLKDIVEVGSDMEFTPGGTGCPTVWVSGLSVAGK